MRWRIIFRAPALASIYTQAVLSCFLFFIVFFANIHIQKWFFSLGLTGLMHVRMNMTQGFVIYWYLNIYKNWWYTRSNIVTKCNNRITKPLQNFLFKLLLLLTCLCCLCNWCKNLCYVSSSASFVFCPNESFIVNCAHATIEIVVWIDFYVK